MKMLPQFLVCPFVP